jgi:hypothetical protein
VQDKAQDAANSARFQMDQKNNEFNNAVLHLEDTIQLCNTPQPPSGCDHTLEEAQANVKCKSTLTSSTAARALRCAGSIDARGRPCSSLAAAACTRRRRRRPCCLSGRGQYWSALTESRCVVCCVLCCVLCCVVWLSSDQYDVPEGADGVHKSPGRPEGKADRPRGRGACLHNGAHCTHSCTPRMPHATAPLRLVASRRVAPGGADRNQLQLPPPWEREGEGGGGRPNEQRSTPLIFARPPALRCIALRCIVQAISQKDDQIRGAEGQIQAAVAAKGKTAEAYADIVRQCAPHLDRRGGGGGAEQRRGYHL